MAKPLVQDNADEKDSFVDELKPGTKLMHGQYTIESFLNAGGFGITYLARDSLDRKIVIKECFPGAFCRRSRYVVQARSRAHQNELKSIVRLFVQEARSLAKLSHPNIVGVHQVFEDNDTAYMALDFVEGRDLLDTIEDPNHDLTPVKIKAILKDVLGAVGFIHEQGILHRDISPDNILISTDMRPVLIDFGAAREEATKQSRVLSALRVVKDGYSPQEFYIAGSEQGPSSDLYALAATFYHLISKDVPPNSQARLAAIASGDPDPYVKLVGRITGYDEPFLAAMDKALEVLPKDRLQSAKAWLDMMDGAQGNVTPLKIATPKKEAVQTTASQPKSKMPLLLGSAAVVALLVGAGIFMSGSGTDPVTAPVTADAPSIATSVAEPAQPQTELPTVADTTVAQEPVTETQTVTDQTAEAPTLDFAAAEITPLAPDATAVEDALAAVVTETPEPAVTPEPAEEAAVIDPLPLPAEMPQTAQEPEVTAQLPETSDLRPAAESDVAAMTLPATPDLVADVGTGPVVDIAAIVPGNEVSASTVMANWTVDVPFVGAGDGSNIIASVTPGAPAWAQPGLVVTDVNGVEIAAISDIPDALRGVSDTSANTTAVDVTFGTLNPTSGERIERQLSVPVVQTVALPNGVAFETSFADASWRTMVTAVPSDLGSGLQEGDIVTSYIPTAETLTDRDSILTILNREIDNGTDRFMFAVQRDGSMWVASVTFEGAGE
ncbi:MULTISPECIES: protein kinase domain-containing protein [unclassified Yoonia]|uniref:protein kinase domain-containing protein n=1 Tax=unclassified Yoonia TaxID=2629118 RepID=UPI002AFED060|nr:MULTISPECIES: protein kinase [unclassified Yoonia]